jgi:hypothetical protein
LGRTGLDLCSSITVMYIEFALTCSHVPVLRYVAIEIRYNAFQYIPRLLYAILSHAPLDDLPSHNLLTDYERPHIDLIGSVSLSIETHGDGSTLDTGHFRVSYLVMCNSFKQSVLAYHSQVKQHGPGKDMHESGGLDGTTSDFAI